MKKRPLKRLSETTLANPSNASDKKRNEIKLYCQNNYKDYGTVRNCVKDLMAGGLTVQSVRKKMAGDNQKANSAGITDFADLEKKCNKKCVMTKPLTYKKCVDKKQQACAILKSKRALAKGQK